MNTITLQILSCSLLSDSGESKLSNLDKDLQWAIGKGHFARVKRLIDKGADINLVDGDFDPVMVSIRNDNDSIASYLIEKGANLEVRSTLGYTPLLYVCFKGYASYAKFLVEQGADVKKTNMLFQEPLDLLMDHSLGSDKDLAEATKAFINAGAEVSKDTLEKALARKNGYRTIQLILKQLDKQGDSSGLPLLFELVILNKTKKVKLLLEYGVDLKIKVHDNSVLAFASAIGTPEIMELLIKYGADINSDNSNYQTYTPLMLASKYGNLPNVKFLLNKGVNINASRRRITYGMANGHTALVLAVENSHTDIARLLIKNKANIYPDFYMGNKKTGKWGLFDIAVENGNIELMKVIENNGHQLDKKTIRHWMYTAIFNHRTKAVKYLLERGADPNYKDSHGGSHLSSVCRTGDLNIVKLFFKHGAKIKSKKDKILLDVVKSKSENKIEIVKYLLKKGANVNVKEVGKGSVNALIYASNEGDLEMVKLLVNNGANINYYSTLWKQNALTAATRNYYIDVSKYLVKKGINVNKKSKKGFTALMMAVSANDIDFVKFLIKHGAKVSIKNKLRDRSYTALDIANEMKKSGEEINPEIISLLKRKMRRR